MEPKLILIDGYNVIKNTPELLAVERRSLAAARDALVQKLIAKYRHTPHQVVVVFDAQQPRQTEEHVQRVRLIYTCQGEIADAVIARMAREATGHHQTVVVASNDQEVRGAVVSAGGQAASSTDLAAHLNAPPRLLAQRARYRQEVLRRLEGSSQDDAPPRTKGNPRRPKKRRRGETPPPSPL
ncbi:MAG TPA: NYN domain-containing protein [Ktedonobacterales bacterium]|nr:NYN domain-containing protein [Ktedonobacterales bacterium]